MAIEADATYIEKRLATRDEVHYRTRAIGPDAQPFSILIVNISAMGLMARCDMAYTVGDVLKVSLPLVGMVEAEIRWSLGGRIGCQLASPIERAKYYELLAALLKPN